MSATPSPRANRLETPSWLDARLVLGVLLVLVSVVVGARVLAGADRTDVVWAAARDLAPGATLRDGDLQPQEVRLVDARIAYLDARQPAPTGNVVQRGLLAGELVPARALKPPSEVPYRQVTLNVESGHSPPDLRVGQLIDVYVTPDDQARAGAPQPSPSPGGGSTLQPAGSRLVLARLAVAAVPDSGGFAGGTNDRAVVLNVAPGDVLTLVRAVAEGRLDLVRLPADGVDLRGTGSAATDPASPTGNAAEDEGSAAAEGTSPSPAAG